MMKLLNSAIFNIQLLGNQVLMNKIKLKNGKWRHGWKWVIGSTCIWLTVSLYRAAVLTWTPDCVIKNLCYLLFYT